MRPLEELLTESSSIHGHLCAGQVLGVRMAMVGCREVAIEEPKVGKKIIVYVEMDRCATDAIQAVTGCSLGKRTLKFLDYGKMAATFINLESNKCVRVIARDDARDHVFSYANGAANRREAEKVAYRVMPEDLLFRLQPVQIRIAEEDMPGVRGGRISCSQCGEGINFKREVQVDGRVLCVPCCRGGYGRPSFNGTRTAGGPPVVHVVGRKNSGKTMLIERIIPQLAARGYRVGTIKHHHSTRPIDMDWKGKDSWRHRRAGAKAVAVVSSAEAALFREMAGPAPLSQVISALQGVDLVLVEGFRSEAHLEIRITDDSAGVGPIETPERLLAVIGAQSPIGEIPTLGRDDILPLVDLIEKTVLSSSPASLAPASAGLRGMTTQS